MIDTISLGTEEFAIQSYNRLVKRVDTNQETGETLEKYFINLDTLNLTIDGRGLRLHFSLPKLYGLKDNFYPLGVNSFEVAVENLQRALEDIGVIADLDKMKVLRLDLFKNVITEKSFNSYAEVLRTLELKRTHRREYADGFLTANTLRELCFYNKVRELSESLGFAYVRQVYGFSSENVMRGEIRFLQHREVKKNNITFLKEIPENWLSLKEVYRNYMKEVFKYELKGGVDLNSETLKALIDFAMNVLRQEGREALKVFGLYPFAFVNRGELLDTLKEHYSRRQAFQILSEIERNKKKYGELYKTLD
ncbi:MAG: hypothetical protein ACP5IN_07930, partial [Caldimicrobium sp.]